VKYHISTVANNTRILRYPSNKGISYNPILNKKNISIPIIAFRLKDSDLFNLNDKDSNALFSLE